jgi:predicted signal transduction protein with EAL and GGDEF domain
LRVVGAAYAEELIRNATVMLRRSLGEAPRIYHVGPARCAVLLDESAIADIDRLADTIDVALRGTVTYSKVPFSPDPVMGVYVFALGDVENSRDVLRRLFNAADDACKSGAPIAFYNEIVDRAHVRSFTLISDMRDALADSGEFSLVYQPVVDFASCKCVGAEALLRWRHKTLGDIGPAEFIPLAEGDGLDPPADCLGRRHRAGPVGSVGTGWPISQDFDQHIGAKSRRE